MRAIRQTDFGGLDVLHDMEIADPSPNEGEVLVKVVAAASCYVDLTLRRGMRKRMVVPRTIGHEGAGIVEEVGRDVSQPQVGDPVLIRPSLPCYACRHCLGEHTGRCLNHRMLGEEIDGLYADAVVVPANMTMPLPAGVSFAAAAVAGCGISSAESGVTAAAIQLGEVVLVRGASGGIGIHAALLAQIAGAGVVIGTTTQEDKLAFIESTGITPLLVKVGDERAAEQTLKEMTNGGPDVIIDVVGAWGDTDYTRWAARGGRVVFVGDLLGKPVPINPSALIYRDVSVLVGQGTTYPSIERCLRLLASGRLVPVIRTYNGFDGLMATQEVIENGSALGRAVALLDPVAESART
jgi:D-arabinose 1-dehydrogenase-like Zn-dependent alcohol dehydrogenase